MGVILLEFYVSLKTLYELLNQSYAENHRVILGQLHVPLSVFSFLAVAYYSTCQLFVILARILAELAQVHETR